MKVLHEKKEIEIAIEKEISVQQLFVKLNLNPLTYIVIDTTRSMLLTPDTKLSNEACIELRPIVSGG